MTETERSDETPDGVGRATVDATVERPDPGRRFLALTFAGLASLAGAVLVVTVPSLAPGPGAVAPEALRTLASAAAVAVGLIGLYTICFEPVPDGQTQRETDAAAHEDLLRDIESVERPSDGPADLVGGDIDRKLERIGGRVDPDSGPKRATRPTSGATSAPRPGARSSGGPTGHATRPSRPSRRGHGPKIGGRPRSSAATPRRTRPSPCRCATGPAARGSTAGWTRRRPRYAGCTGRATDEHP